MFNHKLNKQTDNSVHSRLPFKKNSILFAPMEGVTNYTYRKVIRKLYPQWDALCADFIRVPSNGLYPLKYLKKHIGTELLDDKEELSKTMVQVLTSPLGKCLETIQQLIDLGVTWIDLNIGCPSGTVVRHKGGSYWLKAPVDLLKLVEAIRKIHPHFFSVKMRIGFEDSNCFIPILQGLESCGVDAVTVHARTREQMYSTPANWNFITEAVQHVSLPIIANGDIWTLSDAQKVMTQTGCHSAMIARGALKCPWLHTYNSHPEQYLAEVKRYFFSLIQAWQEIELPETTITKKIKELSRYIFEDIEHGVEIKRSLLLAPNYYLQMDIIKGLR